MSLVDLDSVETTIKRVDDDVNILEHIVFVVRFEELNGWIKTRKIDDGIYIYL